MARSRSKWTIDPIVFGMSLDELVATQLPTWDAVVARTGLTIPQPPGYSPRRVDDFSPEADADGTSVLNILPFSQLGDAIQDGDVIVFMERRASLDVVQLMKQRGWHAEIAFRRSDGTAVQCAPWGGESEIQEHPCVSLHTHRHYDATRWSLHIFRVSVPATDNGNMRKLLEQVPKWRHIYHHYNFPSGNWQFDPVDFGDVVELETIARNLIRGDTVPDMFCMQWVHAVLSLGLNVPLSRANLARLGILDIYSEKWSGLGFSEDNLVPLGQLPIRPYTPSDLVAALTTLYLGTPSSLLSVILPTLLGLQAVQDVLKGAPPRTILPISPFSEYRKPDHSGTVRWEYVATAFADAQCRLQ
jgi:hypothetical protein